MSSVPRQLATFVAMLAVLFAGGALAGQVIDPDARGDGDEPVAGHGAEQAHSEDSEMTSPSTHDSGHSAAAADVHGLAIADRGLRVEVVEPEPRRGRAETLAFRVVQENGEAVNDFDVTSCRKQKRN